MSSFRLKKYCNARMSILKTIVTVLILHGCFTLSDAVRNSTGRGFAVVFPASMNDATTGQCIAYISAKQNADITVTDTINGTSNHVVTAQTTLKLSFTPSSYRLVNGIESKVVYIESTSDITVALSNLRNDDMSDMTLALPKYEGTNDYHVISHRTQDTTDCNAGSTLSFYNVAAYDDNTVVTIYEPQQGQYVQINQVTLNRFQVFTQKYTNTDIDITGLYIVSDKAVSVTAGNSCADLHTPSSSGTGPIWSSMQTDVEVGHTYITPEIYHFSIQPYRVRVLAIRSAITVTFSNSGYTTNLTLGEFVDIDIAISVANEVIQCSNSCVVAQFGTNNDDYYATSAVFMTVLPSTEQYPLEAQFTFSDYYSSAYSYQMMFLIVMSTDIPGSNIKMDGVDFDPDECSSADDYTYCVLSVGDTETYHILTADVPFFLTLYGHCQACEANGYGYIGGFVSMSDDPVEPPEPDRNSTVKKPQYEITMTGMFYSSDGSDFTANCGMDYSRDMNDKALSMLPVVNDRIGIELCVGYTTDDMDLIAASSIFQTVANTGDTKLWFVLRIGSDSVTPSIVESCSNEIDNFLVDHNNWGDPLLPTLPGCPGVVFTSRMFNDSGNVWICPTENVDDKTKGVLAVPIYILEHSGLFSTADSSDISLDCLSGYGDNFQLSTLNQMQVINNLIASGDLCASTDVSIDTASTNIYNMGSNGQTFQEYAFSTGNSAPEQLYICIDEVSSYLKPHTNWPSPVIPAPVGCPDLVFSPPQFTEDRHRGICI